MQPAANPAGTTSRRRPGAHVLLLQDSQLVSEHEVITAQREPKQLFLLQLDSCDITQTWSD